MNGKDNRDEILTDELKDLILSTRYQGTHAMVVMGMNVVEMGPGWVIGEMELEEKHMNPIGSVHGGIIFTFADSMGGTAACTRGNLVTTSNGSINFLNAAIGAKKLIAHAKEIKAGKTLMYYDVEITTETGKLIAKANMEYFNLKIPFGEHEKLIAKGKKMVGK